jgi:hypothetical protein
MKKLSSVCALTCALIFSTNLKAAEAWTVSEGLMNPESVAYDAVRDRYYVSNVAGVPNEKDGVGFISIVGGDGTMTEAEWVSGLNAPKGTALLNDTLYVSDIDRLVAIDVTTGEISGTWDAEGAQFLNDVALSDAGDVYVSDMFTDAIWRLSDDSFELWLQYPGLMHPNGLRVDGERLVVAAWGTPLNPDFSTGRPGYLVTVGLANKAVTALGSIEPVGNLDGIAPDGEGNWIVSDWLAGALYRIDAEGNAEMLMDLNQGSADIDAHMAGGSLRVIVPMMNDSALVAYTIE